MATYKVQHPINVAPENMKENELYALTLNPGEALTGACRPNEVSRGNIVTDYHAFDLCVKQKLLSRLHHCEVQLYWEVSPHGKLHLHGYLLVSRIISFFLEDLILMMNYCTVSIEQIDDCDKWAEYVHKQTSLMAPWCYKHEMSYPITSSNPEGFQLPYSRELEGHHTGVLEKGQVPKAARLKDKCHAPRTKRPKAIYLHSGLTDEE